MQLLHVNEKCGRELNEALILCPNGTDTFGILSVFIDVGENRNEDFEPIIEGKANDTWCDVNQEYAKHNWVILPIILKAIWLTVICYMMKGRIRSRMFL